MIFNIAAAMAMSLDALFAAPLRSPTRHGPGRKTLYTRWKKVPEPDRSRAPVITWPDPLTRQCRRQLERQVNKLNARRMRFEARKARRAA